MVGRWFSPGTLASSTTKTGRHDIAEILLKVALNTKIQIQIQKHILEVINGTQKNTTLLTLENHILNVIIGPRKKQVLNIIIGTRGKKNIFSMSLLTLGKNMSYLAP